MHSWFATHVKVRFLLLAVDFANHRHPFFDVSQHAQIGAARAHWIARRTWRGIGRIDDTLGNDTLGHGYVVPNRVWLTRRSFCSADMPNTPALPSMKKAQGLMNA